MIKHTIINAVFNTYNMSKFPNEMYRCYYKKLLTCQSVLPFS